MHHISHELSRFGSAVGDGVQPAAGLRHVQGHNHAKYVLGALSARAQHHPVMHFSRAHGPSRLPSLTHTPALHIYSLPWTRQRARKFNQPLSFDTSSVTDTGYMFRVSTSTPIEYTDHKCRPTSYMPSPWQDASGFNQPLTFDTSSVTDMWAMFAVRSARLCSHVALRRPTRLLSRLSRPPDISPCIVYNVLSFRLCRVRRRSTSRCTSTLPVSLEWSPCSLCATPRAHTMTPISTHTQTPSLALPVLHALTPTPPPHAATSAARPTPIAQHFPFNSAASVGLRPAPEF